MILIQIEMAIALAYVPVFNIEAKNSQTWKLKHVRMRRND